MNAYNMNNNMMTPPACPSCQNPLETVPGSRFWFCPACQQTFSKPGNDSLIPVESNFGAMFYAWIPQGWNAQVYADGDWCSSHEPIAHDLLLNSPDGTSMNFYPRAWFFDTPSMKYGINPMTMQNCHRYMPMDQYVIQRIQDIYPGAQNIQIQRLPGELLDQKAAQFVQESKKTLWEPTPEKGKFAFSFQHPTGSYTGFFASILVHKGSQEQEVPPQPAQPEKPKMDMGFFMRGGLIGAKMRGEQIPSVDFKEMGKMGKKLGSSINGRLWGRCMDVILTTPNPKLYLYESIFDDFMLNIQYGPGYEAAQKHELELVNQIQLNGAMQRSQMQAQASQKLTQTLNQRSNIVMSGWENRQAAQSRMSNNFSEAIRGVNSYTNSYGQKVEASVRYDHVYQKGSDYIASDANINLGPDWTELKRNK